jgi:peptidoglycan/LPS O-acetylase OafA/YrhL
MTDVTPVSAGQSSGRRGHLDAVDVVRIAMIGGVIAVHVVAATTNPNDVTAGAVTALLHINREVFFFLSAFVLTYSYAARHHWSVTRFWRKRYLLVGVPYLVWTTVYFLADGGPLRTFAPTLHRFLGDLGAGTARYHLYFLLVTMQIYLAFPILLWLVRATRRHHLALLAGSLVLQTGFTALLHYTQARPAVLWPWVDHPDQLLPSYQFYVLAGAVAAFHFEEATAWVRAHQRWVTVIVATGLAVGTGGYLFDHYAVGLDVAAASEVFQPMVAVTSAVVILGLYALGLRWADRGAARRLQTPVRIASDGSFGVYLAHPLLLQAATMVAAPLVRPAAAGHYSSLLVLPIALLLVTPALFVATALAVRAARHTRASLALTGRRRLVSQPRPVLVPQLEPSTPVMRQ